MISIYESRWTPALEVQARVRTPREDYYVAIYTNWDEVLRMLGRGWDVEIIRA